MNITIIGGMQKHQAFKYDGIVPCLTSSMGCGGGYVPMITVKCKDLAEKIQKKGTQMIEVLGTLDPKRHSQMDVIGGGGLMQTLDTLDEKKKVGIPLSFIDKNVGGINRMIANTLTAREDRGVSVQNQTGTAVMVNIPNEVMEIKVREATKTGYAVARGGCDSINLTAPRSTTRRGRVGVDMANTLDTGCKQGIFVEVSEDLTVYAVWYERYQCYIAIRRLTPKECFRLQGWTDDYFEKAQFVNSDSQLYKQAGNGVSVNVVQAVGERIKQHEKI